MPGGEQMTTSTSMRLSPEGILELLNEVQDPEIPVISVVELGVVRKVEIEADQIIVTMTPTYSGCPAMRVMEQDVVAKLLEHGMTNVRIQTVLSPPWTTDWLSDEAREKLRKYGIAPPGKVPKAHLDPFRKKSEIVACPLCESTDTKLTSEFGSTACKAFYHCNACSQPFEQFKCI